MRVTTFPPRLHVLLARDAPLGVVIRRGPSDRVATLLWHRQRDTFELGQWLKGRLYERRCDLSPSGTHLLYFAMNGQWKSESRGSWTAISRAPYLRAIAFFPKGDCWHGGGLFTGARRYWLNDGYGHSILRDTEEVTRDRDHRPDPTYGGECPGVYYHRLTRDGWTFESHRKSGPWTSVDHFERPLLHGYRLRKIAHAEFARIPGKGCYWDEHIVIEPDGTERPEPDWEWAELDGARVVFAKKGALYAQRFDCKGRLAAPTLLFDFAPMTFEARVAPYT
ncbi:MAG: hypothetical protein K1X94_33285 [Sandaracinaceae bacterium]|nr:hypothetical protein [Sandaracinaceae bacterium]